MSNFIKNLKIYRDLKKMNQLDLAKVIGVTQASISQFEKGKRLPSIRIIKKNG